MLSAFKHKKSVSSSLFSPLLPLLPESLPKTEDKTSFITMELKAEAGGPATSSKYKKSLALFDEGSPQQWIDLQRDIMEVWTQNALATPEDRMAIIKTVLRGESLTTFEASIAENPVVDAEGNAVPLTMDMVTLAMTAITSSVFPHRALENQKQWMRKVMRKPTDLSTRLTASALSRLNNCLPLFPGGAEASKFTAAELLEILECSLPHTWRQKFDLDGYVPTDGNRALLITHCEAIERNQPDPKEDKKEVIHSKGKKSAKHARTGSSSFQKREPPFNCTQHGKNHTHNTSNCYVLNKAQKPTQSKTVRFTNNGLRKEINLLARSQDKDKVLDMYMTVINNEKAKLNKKKVAQADVPMDADTDSDNSIALIEQITKAKKRKLKKNKLKKIQKDNEKTPEEINFLQKTYAMESDTSSEG